MPEESLETSELKESLDQGVELAHGEHKGGGHGAKGEGGGLRWTSYLSLQTAIIAVFAAVASLESGGNSNEAILAKNEAILYQSQASDQWAYYQAKGVKESLAANQALLVGATNVTPPTFARRGRGLAVSRRRPGTAPRTRGRRGPS